MGKSRGMNERIQKLRDISVNTPVHIDLERAKIETDFYKENDGKYSIPVMRAMTLKEYFSKKTLYLGDGELIVGEKGRDPQASPTFPELCCHSEEDMVVMSERELVSFKTTEEDRKLQREEAERSKALAIFQATIDTLASVVGFMSDPGGWAGIAMSAMAAATGAAQIAAIAAEPLPSYAVGAVDINEDQIAQLHQGELVVPKTFAEGIRDGDISIGGSESKVEVTIINNTGAVATAERVDNGDITQLKITIGETIASEIAKGRLDSAMTRRFNITRRNQRG